MVKSINERLSVGRRPNPKLPTKLIKSNFDLIHKRGCFSKSSVTATLKNEDDHKNEEEPKNEDELKNEDNPEMKTTS